MAVATATALTIAATVYGAHVANKSLQHQKQVYAEQKELQEEAKEDFDKRIEKYEQSEFVPLDIEALKTENVYEELEVDTSAADYAREQFQQQQANIMQGFQGVAGSSGVAAMATGLSMQAADQSRQTGLSIGQQLATNRRLALGERAQQQASDRSLRLANMQGANAFELDKMATLMGVSGQKAYAASAASAQAQQNIYALQAAQYGMYGNMVQAASGLPLGTINYTAGQGLSYSS